MKETDWQKLGESAAKLEAILRREGLASNPETPALLMLIATAHRLHIPRETWLEGCRAMRELAEDALALGKKKP